jgi:hypothetical protein
MPKKKTALSALMKIKKLVDNVLSEEAAKKKKKKDAKKKKE